MDNKKKCDSGPSLAYTSSPDYRKPPKLANPVLQCLGAPHIDSFNYMLEDGLKFAVQDLIPTEFELPGKEQVTITIDEAAFFKPEVPIDAIGVTNQKVYPTECRQRAATYKGELKVLITVDIDGKKITTERSLGLLPIMLRSKMCHLANLSPKELIECNEHAEEWGGYFVVKGHERLARMLLVTRRNYPVAVRRGGWRARGALFSDAGVMVRCVRPDQTSTNNVLHFLQNGTCKVMFSYYKMMYYAPLILLLKSLCDFADHQIYKLLIGRHKNDLYYVNCVQNMLRELHEEGLHSRAECRAYLGRMFRPRLRLAPWRTDEDAAAFLLDRCVMIHLKTDEQKFHALVFSAQKLFQLAQNKCKVEGADALMCQELLLGGHLYLQVLKDRLQALLDAARAALLKTCRGNRALVWSAKELDLILKRCGTLERRMETFVSTGAAPAGLAALPQYKGLTIAAENINRMRYMSHFKAIHRGAFFMEMRTTEARQLLPDAWGFVCPVHTPDGAPCGLLNHLAARAQVTTPPDPELVAKIPRVLESVGLEPIGSLTSLASDDTFRYPVMLDGALIGYLCESIADRACKHLRVLKTTGELPYSTEIVLVPQTKTTGQYPGVFLFTTEARLMRPVVNRLNGRLELLGTMEQVYLDVAVSPQEVIEGVTTHLELSKCEFMSNLAQLVPMPDCNQSPRNMYQCQMGKQTMGTPIHTWHVTADTKLYRLQTPAAPLFRPRHHDALGLDDYPMGTNAVVAVVSYTGYDMEDAMIISRAAHQRGFAAGFVYKSESAELPGPESYFCADRDGLDSDGLPAVGQRLEPEDPLYSYFDGDKSAMVTVRYRGKEPAVVDSVRQSAAGPRAPRRACIVLRVQRNPTVGDKFASRAGQKGICSQLWPAEDLPFTESGLIPDILFNPHGFPSRMTIAMMIETMAGKSAAAHGLVHDATPFRFNERQTAVNHFGRSLTAAGYAYNGTERLYSGADGREMTAAIFTGVVHYQRLRHMVSDKWQVRTDGAVDALTRQPVKGRRRGGGVRLGEMERDALLSHGASFTLSERLLHGSDKTQAGVCTACGSLTDGGEGRCRLCAGQLGVVQIPYIFKYFATQLAAVNIRVKVDCRAGIGELT